jgi:hypothetical protein
VLKDSPTVAPRFGITRTARVAGSAATMLSNRTPAMIEISSGSPRIWPRMSEAEANSCGFTASTTASVCNAGP